QQIRQLGVELSVDDFGTGYSNLHYLGQLDIQKLKIDKSFVMQLTNTPNKANDLTAAIIDIAKRFQLKTIAEGIETPEIAQILRSMKCEVGQGFYWSKPVPLESLLVFLENFQQNSTKH
ncbi:MAG: diguanylate cyclase/phosphodiesterase (GGDEF & EAL domains) with PAS/PAC sensor(s), partial [uncultured Thiotrichaceae bacterium]